MEAPPLERRLAAILAAGCRGLQPPDAWRRRNDDGHVCPPVHESCRPRPRAVAGARPRDRRGSDAETRRILRKRQRTPRSRFGSDIRDWRHRGRRSSSRRRDARMRRPDRAGKPIGPKHPGRCHQRRRWVPSQFASLPPDKLRDLREGETRAALSALGAVGENLTFLRLPDRFVPSSGTEAQRAAAAIANVACAIDATALAVTWPHDPHCDHLAAWHLVRQACLRLHGGIRLLTYLIWGHILPPDTTFDRAPIGHRLDISSVVDLKRKAIRAHASQVSKLFADDPKGFVLMPDMLARFERPYELFLESEHYRDLP